MKLSHLLQIVGLIAAPVGSFMLWGAGGAVLAAALVLVLLGVVLEREGS